MVMQGSAVAIVTPFRDGKLDESAFARLIEYQIDNGTNAIVPCGTTGESATMSHEEHTLVIQVCVEIVNGRVPVLAGTGSNSTREAVRLTREAKEVGADAALLITPYYNKPPQEGLYQHYRTIAEAVDIPQIVYNCPGRTGVSISPQTLARLAELENVQAVKDATGSLDWTTEVATLTDLTILSGDDTATLPMMAVGAVGVISVTANIMPREVSEMCRLVRQNNWGDAREIHERIYPMSKLLFIESNPVPVKEAVHLMFGTTPEVRAPLSRLSEPNRKLLREEMQRQGLLSG